MRGHENDDRLVKSPRHASEGAAVVRVDDEEEGPASERVQIAGMKAAAGGGRKMRRMSATEGQTDGVAWSSFPSYFFREGTHSISVATLREEGQF